MVEDDSGNILVGRRNDSNLYTNPGGGCEKNECPYHAAFREFLEETGVKLDSVEMIGSFFTEEKNIIYCFKGKMPESYEIDTSKDPDKECDDWEFKDPNDIRDELHVPINKNFIIQYWVNN